ncbi:unnamed protein product [Moneuplotes crassus]|uniref:Homeobox domain-containing protein n=1 Tax=Euplotes crassus TaxID=5936 RepID=A0AAD1Y4U7_EUPCR|nr:unnamed protein product [Moneuplotes crassus]
MLLKPKILKEVIIIMDIEKSFSESEWESEECNSGRRGSSQKKSSRTHYTTEMLETLNKWIEDHPDYPYPNSIEFKTLSVETGLSERQVRVWFTNTRKRRLGITREEFRLKQNTFIRTRAEGREQPIVLKSAPVPTLDQAVQTEPLVEANLMSNSQQKELRAKARMDTYLPYSHFIKNVYFTAEMVDLNEMCLCDDRLAKYLGELGYCDCSRP